MLCRPCVGCGLETGNFCEGVGQAGHAEWQGGVCLAGSACRMRSGHLSSALPCAATARRWPAPVTSAAA
eukprot:8837185-Alexandrium_andersonii.AAC.1